MQFNIARSDEDLNPSSDASAKVTADENELSNSKRSARSQRTGSKIKASSYVEVNKHGVHGDDSEDDDEVNELTKDMTPMSKRRVGKEEQLKKVSQKLGPYATAFTIF